MIIFLSGEDTFRSIEKMKSIREKFQRDIDPQRTNIHIFDIEASHKDFSHIRQSILSVGLFHKKRLIIIKNILKNTHFSSEMLNVLNKKFLEETTLLFWEAGTPIKNSPLLIRLLEEAHYKEECKILSIKQITTWIEKTVHDRGGKITKGFTEELAQNFEDNLWALSQEINKLLAFADGQPLEKKMLADIASIPLSIQIFDLIDAVFNGLSKQKLTFLLSHILDHENEFLITSLLHRQIRLLYQTKRFLERYPSGKNLANELGVHQYVGEKLCRQSQKFSLSSLRKYLDGIIRTELDIKTGKLAPREAIELLFLKHFILPSL